MTATVVGALVTAGFLGVTHALEPDHVAGISSLTSRYGDSRLSALVGVCFSAGHVALVVAWLAVAAVVLGQTSFPPVLDALGTVIVAVLLGVFGALTAVRGYRAAASVHRRDHADASDPHLHLPLIGDSHNHDHTTGAYLKTGVIGALFTLSPPLSMIAFASAIIPAHGLAVVSLAVVTYTVGITVTMGAIGAGVGTVFGLTQRHRRAYGAARLVIGCAVVVLAASLFASTVPTLV